MVFRQNIWSLSSGKNKQKCQIAHSFDISQNFKFTKKIVKFHPHFGKKTAIPFRELLRQAGFVLQECSLDNNEKEICVIYDLNMEECAASTSDASTTNSDYTMELEHEDSASWTWDLTTSAQNDDWVI